MALMPPVGGRERHHTVRTGRAPGSRGKTDVPTCVLALALAQPSPSSLTWGQDLCVQMLQAPGPPPAVRCGPGKAFFLIEVSFRARVWKSQESGVLT